jgi:hypothetical protein
MILPESEEKNLWIQNYLSFKKVFFGVVVKCVFFMSAHSNNMFIFLLFGLTTLVIWMLWFIFNTIFFVTRFGIINIFYVIPMAWYHTIDDDGGVYFSGTTNILETVCEFCKRFILETAHGKLCKKLLTEPQGFFKNE